MVTRELKRNSKMDEWDLGQFFREVFQFLCYKLISSFSPPLFRQTNFVQTFGLVVWMTCILNVPYFIAWNRHLLTHDGYVRSILPRKLLFGFFIEVVKLNFLVTWSIVCTARSDFSFVLQDIATWLNSWYGLSVWYYFLPASLIMFSSEFPLNSLSDIPTYTVAVVTGVHINNILCFHENKAA